MEGLKKTMKTVSQDCRSPGEDLKVGSLEYDAEC
jgi:hypothetical protein